MDKTTSMTGNRRRFDDEARRIARNRMVERLKKSAEGEVVALCEDGRLLPICYKTDKWISVPVLDDDVAEEVNPVTFYVKCEGDHVA